MSVSDTEIRFLRQPEELAALEVEWRRLAADVRRFVPPFHELDQEFRRKQAYFCVAVAVRNDWVEGIAAFHFGPSQQRFAIGERQAFSVMADTAALFGGIHLGTMTEQAWVAIFTRLLTIWRFDVLGLGEVPVDSSLMNAVARADWPLLGLGTHGREDVHWSIDLPKDFETYLGLLRKSTKRSIRYKINRLEREGASRLEVVTAVHQIDRFLREGEAISRTTYQWDVGQRLENDSATRDRYVRLAGEGRLRCYMLYFDGEPIAFERGEISGRVYHYETPGFLPDYHKHSPGLVLMAYVIADLIENTPCEVFDFGSGGDMTGYKARFGTVSEPCRNLSIANVATPRGFVVWSATKALAGVKTIGRKVLGEGELKRRVKKALRRYEPTNDLV